MIKALLELIQVGEKMPTAIDYFYMPPSFQSFPNEALKKAHQNQAMWLSIVGIHNVSPKVLTNIRFKINANPEFTPIIDKSDDRIEARWTSAPETAELLVVRLDPGERVYLRVFLTDVERKSYAEPQVIVNDRLLSRGMRTVGYYRHRPKYLLLEGAAYATLLVMLCAACFILYRFTLLNPRIAAAQNAFVGWESCLPAGYPKAEVNETLLARHKLGIDALLKMNKVVERQDLFSKDYVVICE